MDIVYRHLRRYIFVTCQALQGTHREQTYITSLDEFISTDNPVRLIDAFVDKLELAKLGIRMPKATEKKDMSWLSSPPPA